MEYKDPMFELLSSLEQIVFKDETRKITLTQKPNPFTEFEQLRRGTELKTDEFARALGVTVAMVQEWESKREKPTPAELKLMRLIQANPRLSKQLMEQFLPLSVLTVLRKGRFPRPITGLEK
ncbi:HTH-type transcriptional regulator [Salmonella enterica]|nr:HTH-type transcriptional regulator [Salmonella enterica]ECF0643406.1 HTH-type transcriptional regulator [Salmonella enterica subsp. enterica serovar Typhi]EBL0564449.1 HTH-type transcriptional regulator [Salmonella enterica]ECV0037705.1 HTH-type transcriptional regulator [Salmonella enterica subsp. enterica serovar Typhi]EDR5473909.1 HTH-type transcriptional regulator [Salmonella enterica subsp. enterica serovar Typhi]